MTEQTRWEYNVQTLGSAFRGPKDEELITLLDEWGEEGWELVSAFNMSNSTKVTLIAKRQLSQTARRMRTMP